MSEPRIKARVVDQAGRMQIVYGESLSQITARQFGTAARLSPSMPGPGWEVLLYDPREGDRVVGRITVLGE